ncbi:hypothetical protein RCL1_001975 [Eukaryota sp. TZLM3-RCL]
MVKLNIAYPATGRQKTIVIDDPRKLAFLMDKRISQDIEGDHLGEEFAGYEFRITGGNDKQGFCMKQGVLTANRVRLLLTQQTEGFRGYGRKDGERRRKSVRGCIISPEIAVINMIISKKGPGELPGLTDEPIPVSLGPKRASKIRKMYNLSKEDDVTKYRIPRIVRQKGDKKNIKVVKIQRLVTPETLQRQRRRMALIERRRAANQVLKTQYEELMKKRLSEVRDRRQEAVKARRAL